MAFGTFSENYEFAAMKSTGISLQRAMRSLTVFIVFLSALVSKCFQMFGPYDTLEHHPLEKIFQN